MKSLSCWMGIIFLACTSFPKEQTTNTDSVVDPVDSTFSPNQFPIQEEVDTTDSYTVRADTIITFDGSFFFNLPDIFEFSVCDGNLTEILGEKALYRQEDFLAGEAEGNAYDAYSICYIIFGKTELVEYSYSGIESAYIDTPLLPLKQGIKVGISKREFSEKFDLPELNQNYFEIVEDYGSVEFMFKHDTLRVIIFEYREGT